MPVFSSNLLQGLGWAVLDSFWQMAIIWVVYQLITFFYKAMPAAGKSALAATALITGFAWFIFNLAGNLLYSHSNSFLYRLALPGNQDLNAWINNILPYASVGYLLLLSIPLWQFYRNYKYVTVIRTTGLEKPAYDWRLFTSKIAAHIGITKKVTLRLSSLIQSPLTVGFLKPIILLPVAAVNQLTPQQIESVILHELAHIRRFDYLVNLICRLIQTILYCNPFAGYFVREHETEREKAADQLVLQFEYDAHAYASALVTLQKLAVHQVQFTMAATGNKNELLQRVEWIMGMGKRNKLSLRALILPLLVVAFFAGINSLLEQVNTPPAEQSFVHRKTTGIHLFTNSELPAGYLFDLDHRDRETVPNQAEMIASSAGNTSSYESNDVAVAEEDNDFTTEASETVVNPYVHAVSNLSQVIPALDSEQQEEVARAMEASKKVFEEISWKEIDKQIADAFSTMEKEQVKTLYNRYLKEAGAWKQLETDLKVQAAYDQPTLSRLNNSLQAEIYELRLDSIKKVSQKALLELTLARKELLKAKEKGIPDSDLTISAINKQRDIATRLISTIDSVKRKRIVDL